LCNSANEDAIQVTVPCPHLGDELKFHCHAVWCELDKAMKDSDKGSLSPLGTLAFIPFITFVNELPCAARVQLLLHTIDTDSVTNRDLQQDGAHALPFPSFLASLLACLRRPVGLAGMA
jgi:hypothetical protein